MAQQNPLGSVPGIGGSSGSGAAGPINTVLDFVADQMLAIGAGISVIFALGVVFAVKFGWMERSKIKDFFWLILAMITVPWIIPAIFQFAQTAGGT